MKNLSLVIVALVIAGVAVSFYPVPEGKTFLQEYRNYAEKFNKNV